MLKTYLIGFSLLATGANNHSNAISKGNNAFEQPQKISSAKVRTYTLDLSNAENRKVSYWLKAGGVNPQGDSLNVNSLYWTKNGKPWLPIMGEFHFVRYPKSGWEDQLLKMKAGGISIVSTYIAWVNSEYPQGVWHWSGDNDLKAFLELCKKHNLYVWLRPGPYINAEAKNGGLPEWANKRGKRTNAPWFTDLVKGYYHQIAQQSKGYFFKDGGPIIGFQLDNEYAHGDSTYLGTLLNIAKSEGMIAPFYTCTNNSKHEYNNGNILPLQGAYPYRGWDGRVPTTDFLYSSDDWNAMQNIGGLPYNGDLFPRGMCEMGVACWQGYTHRFIVPPYDSEGHLQNCLGRGINLVGYYMFQGGTQKSGFEGEGQPLTYDFQAPLGEYGQVRPSYSYMRIIHNFINDFGSELALMQPARPKPLMLDPKNNTDLRYVGRFNGNSGFLFMTNVQNWVERKPIENFQVNIKMGEKSILFPQSPITLQPNVCPIFPINYDLNGTNLRYATAQLMAKITNGGTPYYFFFEVDGIKPEFVIDNQNGEKISGQTGLQGNAPATVKAVSGMKEAFTITKKDGSKAVVVLLSRKQAEQSWRLNIAGKEYLFISGANLLVDGSTLEVSSRALNAEISTFPEFKNSGLKAAGKAGIFNKYTASFKPAKVPVQIAKVNGEWQATFSRLPKGVKDIFLDVTYVGSTAQVFVDGNLYSDDRYNGTVWDIGIKRFADGKEHKITFKAQPWDDSVQGIDPKYYPKNSEERNGVVHSVKPVLEYSLRVK